jgi:hypothetical protein
VSRFGESLRRLGGLHGLTDREMAVLLSLSEPASVNLRAADVSLV